MILIMRSLIVLGMLRNKENECILSYSIIVKVGG